MASYLKELWAHALGNVRRHIACDHELGQDDQDKGRQLRNHSTMNRITWHRGTFTCSFLLGYGYV